MIRSSSSRRNPGATSPLSLLSQAPRKRWPDGAVHHGSRVLLLLVLALAVTLFFPPSHGPRVAGYEVGMVADEEIIATLSFGVPKNAEELERERSSAAAAVPPTFRFQPEAESRMEAALAGFFSAAEGVEDQSDPSQALDRILSDLGLVIASSQRDLLRDPERREMLRASGLRAVREILPRGVLDETGRLEPGATGQILVIQPEGEERYVPRDSVLTSVEFFQAASQLLPAGSGSEVNELFRLALIRFMEPSLRYDGVATEQDREVARRAVAVNKATVLEGEAIVRANQQVGEAEVERLEAYEEALRAQGHLQDLGMDVTGFLASVVLNLLVLGVLGFLVYFFRSDVYGDYRWLLLQGTLILAYTGAAGLVARNQLPVELLPIAFVSLAIAVLWDGRLALVFAATLAVLTGAQPPFQSVHAWLPVFVAGSAAALSVRTVRRRAQTWIFIAIIASAYAAILVTLGVLSGREAPRLAESLAWAGGNAMVSAILAIGFLPVFEWFTRITTDQTLLEWADPNRLLLKRLSMEAPGTYAHTINVANLSEAAANAIGANGLLCRVGVYYHDVGKMLKPQYFIENQPAGRNPHDKLKPATSAAIVREHVTEGMRLAAETGLPDVLLDFIPEHHGTQDISFFLERAQVEAVGADEVDPEEYRYPGPKPQSRETAIVMLADSVESATRALQDPTPERVQGLIDTLVEDKIRQKQLDEAPLTLREIGIIKAQFLKVLSGVYHHRIDYPATRHLTGPTVPAELPPGVTVPATVGDPVSGVPSDDLPEPAAGDTGEGSASPRSATPPGRDAPSDPASTQGEEKAPPRAAGPRKARGAEQPALFPVDGDGNDEGPGPRDP